MSTIGISALTLLLLVCGLQGAVITDTQNGLQVELIVKSDTIFVQCNAVNRNLKIYNYKIKWSDSQHQLGDVYGNDIINGKIEDIIWGLTPCTNYTVDVIPFDENNKIVFPIQKDVQTLPIGPPDFTKIGFGSIKSDTVIVKWQLKDTSCLDTLFHISYSGRKLWGNDTIYKESLSFVDKTMENKRQLRNLQPYSSYELCMTAENRAGTGIADCTEFETSEAKPSPPVGLSPVWVGSTSVTLTWQEPQHVRGVVRHYTVTWATKTDMRNERPQSIRPKQQVKTLERMYTIEGLTEAEAYTVEVTASTGAGQGEAAWIHVTTGAGKKETARIDVRTGAGQGDAAKIDISTGAEQDSKISKTLVYSKDFEESLMENLYDNRRSDATKLNGLQHCLQLAIIAIVAIMF